jgi:predicted metalloprotease with PDZ domain
VRIPARCALLVVSVLLSQISFAQSPIRYIVSLADPERHLVQVTLELPSGRDTHELQLPVWNALYQVRDFSQNMNWIRAKAGVAGETGRPLTVIQLNPSRWKIGGAENGASVAYEMFTDSPGSFGAQLNSHHAFFNLAQILLYADDERNQPAQIEFRNLPAKWAIATPLAPAGGGFTAQNYDQLVDSPIEIGSFVESDFQAACGSYRVIVDTNASPSADPSKILREITAPLQHIVSAATEWMNDCPFQSYMFIYHISDSPGGGGMEHAYSTAISLPEKDFTGSLDHFTSVTAHEFFHLWNVKRIRPQSLAPIDYSKENYTAALWFSEGVDTTASEYIRLRAGLLDEPHYLEHLSREITRLQNRPARLTQSAEQSSLDAWLEKYPRYGISERSISYYNKGELLGVLLDLAMREASRDQASLRQLFLWMNDRYAKQGKFFADSEAVEHSAETLSHADLKSFFEKYISGTDEIPWDKFFALVGLRVIKADITFADPGFEVVRKFDLPASVVEVNSGSNAEHAGLAPGDVILQVNGKPPGPEFETEIARLAPGATLQLVVSRGGVQQSLRWKLESRTQSVFRLQDVPGITPWQKAERARWLFGHGEEQGEKPAPDPAANAAQ